MTAPSSPARSAGWPGRAAAVVALATACALRPAAPRPAPTPARVALILAERGPAGPRLVAVDEAGDRQHVVVRPADEPRVRDGNPAVSPDGRWVVFASSRGRPFDETSLWIAPVGVDEVPARLTDGPAIDAHPAWTADGAAIVFASTRAGGDFDLWRLPLAAGRAAGPPAPLTEGPGHEVTPTVADDGAIVYAAVTPTGAREVVSRLEERLPDGAIRPLTEGPGDVAPALSPDGATLAFARPGVDASGASAELWVMPRGGGAARLLVALPVTDESGPVWSRDGRYLFATSVLRGEKGAVFSAVVFVDTAAPTPRAQILLDHAGAVARLTPTMVAPALAPAPLAAEPEYLPELARIVRRALDEEPPP